jgi:KRAB domain-containing zinc finger protein
MRKLKKIKSDLQGYLLVHNGEQPYSCEACDKTFSYISDIRRHLLVHSGERHIHVRLVRKPVGRLMVLTSICLCIVENVHTQVNRVRTFSWIFGLKRHLFVHSEECPYSYNICNKTFRSQSNLKQHDPMHAY